MAAPTPLRPKPAPLDIGDARNYATYLAGMAVEAAFIAVVVTLAALVSWAGALLWG